MPELIDRGYIYIAQPPLYKIKQGKSEQYVKDDDALFAHLTQNALEGALFYPGNGAPAISALALNDLVQKYRHLEKLLKKYSRRYPQDILQKVLDNKLLTADEFTNQVTMQDWVSQLTTKLQNTNKPNQQYKIELQNGHEGQQSCMLITSQQNGSSHTTVFSQDFWDLKDYKLMHSINSELVNTIDSDAKIERGNKSIQIHTFAEALNWLMSEAQRGQTIQRYKGLGEMNPEQLWETTMDPEVRRMLQVTVEDAIAADEIFTTLMGDCVDPRREFIEANALDAENIDI